MTEFDPTGKDPHSAGAKLDAGKLLPDLVLGDFARALTAVVEVGTFGAHKYSRSGWIHVPDGINRYGEAKQRHWLKEKAGEAYDPDSGLLHAAHEAWNALARLDLILREREQFAALGKLHECAPGTVDKCALEQTARKALDEIDDVLHYRSRTGLR